GDQYSYIEGLVEVPELNLKRASEDTLGLLFDPERYREVTESNFELGSRKFSFETLSAIIRELVEEPL
ncbi:MAG TPA: glycosyl transferase group 1, partial [Mesotoga sp.]|nr:glycosyl transferase group 1 [Mesotoga sp.]